LLAAVYDGSPQIRLVQRDIPRIARNEVLLKVEACSICGTDRRILRAGHRGIPSGTQRTLGHECSGEVVEVGRDVQWPRVGMRLGVSPNIGCGHCDVCILGYTNLCPENIGIGGGIDGGMAEYLRIPAPYIQQGNLGEVPPNISYEEAALNEPLSCSYRGLRACHIQLNESILIVGAGTIGLMMVQLARLMGAGLVIVSQRSAPRRAFAQRFAPDVIVNPEEQNLLDLVMERTGGKGVDVAIVAAPSPEAQTQVIDTMAVHGRVNFFGGLPKDKGMTQVNANQIHYRELCILGTTGQTVEDYRTTMALLGKGLIDVASLISGRFRLEDAVAAFEHAESRESLRSMIRPSVG
jgi:L-iditol 2-dehydrogenase